MAEDIKTQLLDSLDAIRSFLVKSVLGRILLLTSIVGLLQSLGVLNSLESWLVQNFLSLWGFLLAPSTVVPQYYWLVLVVTILGLLVFFVKDHTYLRLVSGVFHDDFNRGLGKWEFGGEGWKSEKENNRWLLSVSESGDGGISKRGFNWTDYEFSFETKIINKNAGFIVRAENRDKYLMVQLNLEANKPRLRLHLKLPPSPNRNFVWVVLQEDNVSTEIKAMEWIKTQIVVEGGNIDVYLNGEHASHYFIADPIRWKEGYTAGKDSKNNGIPEGEYIASIAYWGGRVGFRCSGAHEHAHFKNVKVRPIFS